MLRVRFGVLFELLVCLNEIFKMLFLRYFCFFLKKKIKIWSLFFARRLVFGNYILTTCEIDSLICSMNLYLNFEILIMKGY